MLQTFQFLTVWQNAAGKTMKFGVLALQGDFREHIDCLKTLGASATAVRTYKEIEESDALIIPGGESTTIFKLAQSFGLVDLLRSKILSGTPTYGSCAGMILLSREILDPASGQETFGGLDITVRRNAFGRQVDSFEENLEVSGISGGAINAVFIRAPWVEKVSPEVEVLAQVNFEGTSHPVAVRQGNVLATSFHPEITSDSRIHRYFVDNIANAG